MGNVRHARKLNLSNKELTAVPYYIFNLRNLKVLNLSNNNLKEIPVEISNIRFLKKMDLSNNSINSILAKFFTFKYLTELILNNNNLKSLPRQIGNSQKLEKIFLNGNQINTLPEELGSLQNLRQLSISNNNFTIFPNVIFELKNLTHLWIGRNDFNDIPFEKIKKELPLLKYFYTFSPDTPLTGKRDNVSVLLRHRSNSIKLLKMMTEQYLQGPLTERKPQSIKQSKNIFISYSHLDKEYKEEVEKSLQGLKHVFPDMDFDFWADDRIKPGQDWENEIKEALDSAGVAILIASRNFIASKFIMNTEVPKIIQNAETNGTLVLTLVAGESMLNKTSIGKFQWVNSPHEPLKALKPHEQDVIYNRLTERISEHFITF